MRQNWQGALDAFGADSYTNELGVVARADRLADVTADLAHLGLQIDAWYGVRVFTDPVDPDTPPPPAAELALLLAAEQEAAARDPYRQVASQLHIIATRA
jgi:hypothetical protein